MKSQNRWLEVIVLLLSLAFPLLGDWKTWFLPARRDVEFHAAGCAIRLEDKQHLKLHNAAGTLVQIVCGAVWITQEGDIKDSFLRAGECFRIERTGETLIAPLSSASLRLLQSGADQRQDALALMPAGGSRSL